MFLGILIAMAVFGLLMFMGNIRNAEYTNGATVMVAIGLFCLFVGTFGAIGWLVEVFL